MSFPFLIGYLGTSVLGYFLLFALTLQCEASPITRIPANADIPQAVRLTRSDLLHTSLLSASSHRQLFADLEIIARSKGAALSDVVRLNLYLSTDSPSLRAATEKEILNTWAEKMRPVITIIPSRLPHGAHTIAADAVIALSSSSATVSHVADAATLPANRDALFLSGRTASGELLEATAGTMTQLFEVLAHLGARPADVVQVKAFIQPMTEWETVERAIEESFGDGPIPPVVYVEWSSKSRSTEIELIAAGPATKAPQETISYFTPPGDKASPVFSRVARLHAKEIIYISGLTGTSAATPEEETRTLFTELEQIAIAAGSSLLHLAKATYYVSSGEAGTALGKLRPDYYDPARPPTASKIDIPAIGVPGRHLLIDMTAAPAN